MTPEEFKKYLASLDKKIENAKRDSLKVIGKEVATLFKRNFEQEGFFGDKWDDVKRRDKIKVSYRTKKGKKKYKERPRARGAAGRRKILHGQGRNLSRSIKHKVEGNTVTIFSDLPYSAAHNEGTTNAGRNRNITIPKRQFIGENPEVDTLVKNTLEQIISKAIKN